MQRTFSKFAIVSAAFAAIVGITVLITGQPASKLSRQPLSLHRLGVPDDWSHHHLVFSNPGTYEQAVKTGAAYVKWLTIRYNTRFILQQMKRHAEAAGGLSGELSAGGEEAASLSGMVHPEGLAIGLLGQVPGQVIAKPKPAPKPMPIRIPKFLKRDWSESFLTGTVQPNAYPAKWGASLTSLSCFDYVVYPTGNAGSSTAASIVAYYNLYTPSCTEITTVPSTFWAYNTAGTDTGATISTSPIISGDGSQVAFIQSDGTKASLVLLKPVLTVQATLADGYYDITITSGTVPQTAVGMQIIGGGINAGTTISSVSGSIVTMSTKAQNNVTAETVYITMPGTLTAPASLTSQTSSANYQTCAAPCMLTLPLSGPANDTFSAPFYDFATDDAIYVGDDSGYLHQFSGVFTKAPSEVTTSPWPVLLNASNKVTSPVYDPATGYVFVGDTGGYLYSVGSAGKYGTSAQLGDVIIDAPLVDSSAGMVYAFVTANSGGYNAVFQFPTGFTTGTGNGGVPVGTGGAGYYLYAGDFDNVYYESSAPSGNLYVVGNTGVTSGAMLYQIPITSNVMGSATGVASVSTGAHPWPSPLTEFCNNYVYECSASGGVTTSGTDYLFFSVNMGNQPGCTNYSGNGCVLSFNITTPSSPSLASSLNVPNVASSGCWATGGFVIDNSDLTARGASQVYFIDLNDRTAGGADGATSSKCASGSGTILAVQASQAGLD
jgi:hypothetical protein